MGWSAGRHVDHACGGQISPWPARKVTDTERFQRCLFFSRENQQQIATDRVKLRRKPSTADSGSILLLVRKGPLGISRL